MRPATRKLWRAWTILGRSLQRVFDGDLTTVAGGMALFSLLATVPMIAVLVAIYGLAADPMQAATQLEGLERVLPTAVATFMSEQLARTSDGSTRALATTLASSLALALYSARGAVNASISGLNAAYRCVEHRARWRRYVQSVVLAVGAVVSFLALIFAVVALPTVVELLFSGHASVLAATLRWPVLLVFVSTLYGLLYRWAPARVRTDPSPVVWPGAIVGTSIWVFASLGLAWWVERAPHYQVLYGAFASVVVVILWFYISALTLLIGAALNAEIAVPKSTPK